MDGSGLTARPAPNAVFTLVGGTILAATLFPGPHAGLLAAIPVVYTAAVGEGNALGMGEAQNPASLAESQHSFDDQQ